MRSVRDILGSLKKFFLLRRKKEGLRVERAFTFSNDISRSEVRKIHLLSLVFALEWL